MPLAALLLWLPSAPSHAGEIITWLLRDFPPLSIFEGEQKGHGVIDLLMPQLIANLPEYQHELVRVNRARGMQMLREPSFTCDPSLIWSKERAQWVAFSITSFRVLSNGLAIRRADREQLTQFIHDGKVDLHGLLDSGKELLGVVAERSYGQQLDNLLQQVPPSAIHAHYGNDALGSLLQMQRLGRLQLLLGYRAEIRYQAVQQGIDPQDLEFYPIEGISKYQEVHVGCSDTPQGRLAITRINQTLLKLREERLVELYAAWLEPGMRDEYRADARSYFQDLKDH
ncbi:TIGR02285 family protein [Pseudomonas sp. Fl5BN2]|uniref:TIGR02285 family protein n=1 Tax=unclassified Pseudomonas TaxID=196821 RepID=UPI001378A018|nr:MULTISPECIES: TIGR02285 family protein [unclassified Pseudomonas]NBF04835.1 TIGR02285 family protein [Pseudomonas sp. Fl5BN2]NBF10228.1 TIGR02285 family protein [Pseudomonas sp. Fl4BN1]